MKLIDKLRKLDTVNAVVITPVYSKEQKPIFTLSLELFTDKENLLVEDYCTYFGGHYCKFEFKMFSMDEVYKTQLDDKEYMNLKEHGMFDTLQKVTEPFEIISNTGFIGASYNLFIDFVKEQFIIKLNTRDLAYSLFNVNPDSNDFYLTEKINPGLNNAATRAYHNLKLYDVFPEFIKKLL
jgi:hypothetical protein